MKKKSLIIKKNWKYYTGMTLLSLSLLLPLIGFAVPFLNLHITATVAIIGFLTIGGPEIAIMIAVIFLGKNTLLYYKDKFFKLFLKKPYKPVSKARYYIGLLIFFASTIPQYFNAYTPHFLPGSDQTRYYILVGADLFFVLSFFILGGNFWEKFKRLFIWDENNTIYQKGEKIRR